MQPRTQKELAWADRPFPELVRLAWPIAVSMLSYAVMTLADTFFVSRLGPSALAGVGIGGTAAFFVLCFSFGLLRGVKILSSQAVGAGRPEDVRRYLDAGLSVATLLGAAGVAVGLGVCALLPLFVASEGAATAAVAYLEVRILGAPLVLLYVAFREARYGEGDARAPMVASVAANLVNIALDAFLLLGLGLGPEGAAWATNAAVVVEAALLGRVFLAEGWRPRAAEVRRVVAVVRVGIPTGLHFLLEMGAFAALAAIVATMPEVQMAAHQIALQVIHFSFLPAAAVGEAASILAGQAVGARRDDRVRPVARYALLGAVAYTGAFTVLLALGAEQLASVFADDPELVAVATRLLWVAAAFQVFDGANVVGRSVLRGTGDVRFPAVVGVITAWVLTPPLTWWLGVHLGHGAFGGWLGLCGELVLGAGIFWWRVERGGWLPAAERSRALVERAAGPQNDDAPEDSRRQAA